MRSQKLRAVGEPETGRRCALYDPDCVLDRGHVCLRGKVNWIDCGDWHAQGLDECDLGVIFVGGGGGVCDEWSGVGYGLVGTAHGVECLR